MSSEELAEKIRKIVEHRYVDKLYALLLKAVEAYINSLSSSNYYVEDTLFLDGEKVLKNISVPASRLTFSFGSETCINLAPFSSYTPAPHDLRLYYYTGVGDADMLYVRYGSYYISYQSTTSGILVSDGNLSFFNYSGSYSKTLCWRDLL